ncbi:MAG: hypothetical protein Ct9H90mP22_7120 [Gammaproteobacteria bacterium]|nr:MAG: hypothetical protein Ct9H90mP22_7120 [Gammaproteobacteria bacterium]
MCTWRRLLHKPGSKERAVESLKLLSGQKHYSIVEFVFLKINHVSGNTLKPLN